LVRGGVVCVGGPWGRRTKKKLGNKKAQPNAVLNRIKPEKKKLEGTFWILVQCSCGKKNAEATHKRMGTKYGKTSNGGKKTAFSHHKAGAKKGRAHAVRPVHNGKRKPKDCQTPWGKNGTQMKEQACYTKKVYWGGGN